MTQTPGHPDRDMFLNSVNKFRTCADATLKLNRVFNISRQWGIIKDKVLDGSWFTPGVSLSNKYKAPPKKTQEPAGGQSSTYSSDSDEEDSTAGEDSHRRNTHGSKGGGGQTLRKALADWAVRALHKQTYARQQAQELQTDRRMARIFLNPENVTTVALSSRVILLVLQIIVTNLYGFAKHENDGFKFTPEAGYGTVVDKVVNATLGGLANWDGQYFLHLAVHGYTTESTLAFFPLFPMTLYMVSQAVHFLLSSIISLSSIVLIVGWILNTICFMKTAEVLHDITQFVDSGLAPVTVLLFCFNPASVFFSSLYTESLFAFLSAKVVLALYERKILIAMMYASLSTICRSNGLLNFGFIAFFLMEDAFRIMRGNIYAAVAEVIRMCSAMVFFLVPFFQFQVFGIKRFCNEKVSDSVEEGNYKKLPPYCNWDMLPYSYVQQKYWDVGFMNYFEVKQIPNFLLALPVLYILFNECWKRFAPLLTQSLMIRSPKGIFQMYVAFYGMFLALFCFLNVHVQVSTRLILAAFPHFYIYLAESCVDETYRYRRKLIEWPVLSTSVICWCLFYFLIGGIAFPLGYPWT